MADKLTFGSFYFSTPALTTLAAATPAKAAGTTTINPASVGNGFTMPANNRLQLDSGQTTRVYRVSALVSLVKSDGGSTDGKLYIAKNGTIVAESGITRTLANTSDFGAVAAGWMVSLAADDYVELWVETTNGDDVTIQDGGLGATVLG